jgi:NH3-dependent NAD+ synthetase
MFNIIVTCYFRIFGRIRNNGFDVSADVAGGIDTTLNSGIMRRERKGHFVYGIGVSGGIDTTLSGSLSTSASTGELHGVRSASQTKALRMLSGRIRNNGSGVSTDVASGIDTTLNGSIMGRKRMGHFVHGFEVSGGIDTTLSGSISKSAGTRELHSDRTAS